MCRVRGAERVSSVLLCSIIKEVLLELRMGNLSHYQVVDLVDWVPLIDNALSAPAGHDDGGSGWEKTVEEVRRMLRLFLSRNSCEGGKWPEGGVAKAGRGKTAGDEERLLIEDLALKLASPETRHARGE